MVNSLFILEPGYYKDGGFGIRIENVLLVHRVPTANNFGHVDYLGFEHVTWVPIQTKLIVKSLLNAEELHWINKYNQDCFDIVSPQLQKDEDAYLWLQRETRPI